MRVTFDLSDNDLKYFRQVMRDVREKTKGMGEDAIVTACRSLLEEIEESDVPEFIQQRIQKLGRLIDMLEDLDDVQNVYSNADIPDDVLATL